jgi:hypothetical protein
VEEGGAAESDERRGASGARDRRMSGRGDIEGQASVKERLLFCLGEGEEEVAEEVEESGGGGGEGGGRRGVQGFRLFSFAFLLCRNQTKVRFFISNTKFSKSRKSLKVAGVFLLDCGLFLLSGACQA